MKKILSLLALTLALTSAFSQRPLQPGWNENRIDIFQGASTFYMPSMIYLPDDYFTALTKRYPVIFSFHGFGEAGTDTISVLNNGLPKNVNNGEIPRAIVGVDTFKFIIIAVQHNSSQTNPIHVTGIIEDAMKRFRIDSTACYLYGFSGGGGTAIRTHSTATTYDTTNLRYISAIYSRSPATQDVTWVNLHKLAAYNIPVIMLAGNAGGTEASYLAGQWRVQDSLNNFYSGSDTIVLAGVGHNNFETSVAASVRRPKMQNKNIYEWFISHRNSYATPYTSNPVLSANAGADITITMPNNTTALNAAASTGAISGMQWTKLSGPTEVRYGNTLTSSSVPLTNLAIGTYVYQLSITDGSNTDIDTVQIFMQPYAPLPCGGGANTSYTLTFSSGSQLYQNDVKSLLPNLKGGDTIYITPNRYSLIHLRNLEGTPCKPIYIMPAPGTDTVQYELFRLYDAQYVMLDGGPNYRILGKPLTAGTTNGSFYGSGWSRNVTINRMQWDSTENCVWFKNSIDTAALTSDARQYAPNWSYDSVVIKNCICRNTGGEGMYLNHTGSPYTNGKLPPAFGPVYIHDNHMIRTGWDAIQIAYTLDRKAFIYNNIIDSAGLKQIGGQNLGIISGGYVEADIYNNTVHGAFGNGIGVYGHRKVRVFNNILEGNGWNNTQSIYAQSNWLTDAPAPDTLRLEIYNNSIKQTSTGVSIRVVDNVTYMRPAYVANNTICLAPGDNRTAASMISVSPAGSVITSNSLYCKTNKKPIVIQDGARRRRPTKPIMVQ